MLSSKGNEYQLICALTQTAIAGVRTISVAFVARFNRRFEYGMIKRISKVSMRRIEAIATVHSPFNRRTEFSRDGREMNVCDQIYLSGGNRYMRNL